MPPFRRNYYYRRWTQNRRRPRRWFRWRRPRTTVWRRPIQYRRRKRVRRRRFYRKKKLSKIILKTFQPKTIKTCKIKGYKCLIQCGPDREMNNWAQYLTSTIPEHWPTGGGWSQMVFSLASLYQDNEHLENIWTASNAGLNLVRYLGATFYFFQHTTVDYIVTWRLCYPMTTAPLDHANAAPYRMLLEKKKLIIPSMATKLLRKRYRKHYFRPPAQLSTNWYFQQKLCNTPLLLLTTTAVSLNHLYINPKWYSTCVTVISLNTKLFTSHNFSELNPTTGYVYKSNFYLYAATNGDEKITDKKQLIPLQNTKDNTPGLRLNSDSDYKMDHWGNPFNEHNLDMHTRLYYSSKPWTQLNTKSTDGTLEGVLPYTSPILMKCRYCPAQDTGAGNEVYWVKNFHDTNWEQPENFTLKITGVPLHIALWGWVDYTKKIRDITRVDTDHIVVIKSDFFDTKLPYYCFVDESFTQDKGPYGTTPTNYMETHWHPQSQFQLVSLNKICQSGPGTPKPPDKNSFEAHCKYSFKMKWGGCPETLEKVYDPCSQQVYPVPNNLLQTTEIINPESPIEHELYEFDWRRNQITQTAAKRIKTDTKTDDCLSKIAGLSKSSAKAHQEERQETQTQKETKKTIINQLLLHRRNQQLIKLGILKLTQE